MASSSVSRSSTSPAGRDVAHPTGRAGAASTKTSAKSRKLHAQAQAAVSPSKAVEGAAATRSAGRSLAKGQQTKATIVEAALNIATHIGLEGLSIGAIAELTGMSKSGVFAHFGSREELQISVVHEYHDRFEQEVFYPAIEAPRGIPRLRELFGNWMKRTSMEIDSGCI